MKYILLFFLGLSLLNESESTLNYESLALQYYLDSLENKDVFQTSCNCKEEYFTKKTLKVYSSTVNEEDVGFFRDSKIEDFRIDTMREIVLENLPKRIKLTQKLNHYRSWHYYIKFSHRKYLKDKVLISFSLKYYEQCSSQIFSFLMDSKGEIHETDQTNWCEDF